VRRPAQPADAEVGRAAARRRSGLTARAAILALVVCALALALAYPLRQFLAQRAEIGELRQRTSAQEQRVAELKEQKERWKDPAYVKAQARERLHFVMPGEVAYVVLDPGETTVHARGGTRPAPPARPWYGDLWASVQAADGAPR
jgi:cell division protein FtsB